MASKKRTKAAPGGKKTIKGAVSRVKAAVKSAASKGAKRLKKAAAKATGDATSLREKARLRVAKASQKPVPKPKVAKADPSVAPAKSTRRAGQPLLGTRKRPRKASSRIVGGVNL
jgi:hypothetical protein